MKARDFVLGVSILTIVELGLTLPSRAFDLTGAWAAEQSTCPRVFTKNGASIAFTPDSDQWGRGFIVEGNTIRGLTVNCTIKSKKETKSDINLIASCSTDIMIDQVQLRLKISGKDSLTRFFPGVPGMETTLARCSF